MSGIDETRAIELRAVRVYAGWLLLGLLLLPTLPELLLRPTALGPIWLWLLVLPGACLLLALLLLRAGASADTDPPRVLRQRPRTLARADQPARRCSSRRKNTSMMRRYRSSPR